MKRTLPLLLAALLVGSVFVAVPLDATAQRNGTETLPGERFAGVVGTQEAELDGELETRAFGIAVANADSDTERAELVADRLDRNDDRLAEIEARQQTLREQRDAGNISEGTYRAKVAIAVAETSAANRTTNAAAGVAAGLPESVRSDHRIDDERLRGLRADAAELTGPDVADIARDIAGPNVGAPVDPNDRSGGERDASPNGTESRTNGTEDRSTDRDGR
ncbi:DUF7096 domain-containing protein [Natronomonas amylolytica]|uniref:DUF7096 domain-containing protein n=1 Tax=Natronomonas amylolytica TaxID=3108498 RepID=UPI00300A7738